MDMMDYSSGVKKVDKFHPFECTRLILTRLREESYADVRTKTKEGIRKGVEEFLERNGKEQTVCHADLGKFAFDESTKDSIEEKLRDSGLDNISTYAENVCDSYRMFVYNESSQRFAEFFSEF